MVLPRTFNAALERVLGVRIPLPAPIFPGRMAERLCTGFLLRVRNDDVGSTPTAPTNLKKSCSYQAFFFCLGIHVDIYHIHKC